MKIKFEELLNWLKTEDKKGKTTKDNNVVPTQDFVLFEEIICEKCTAEQIYRIANLGLKSTNIKKLANAIIARKDPKYNYMFAKDIPGADIRAHAQAIIESKDSEYNYMFAKDIPGADIKAHAQAIIESKDPLYNYKFAKDIPGADIKAHAQAIIESKDPLYNYMLAKDIPGADILAHAQVIQKFSREKVNSKLMLDEINSFLKSEYNTKFLFDENGYPTEIVPIIDVPKIHANMNNFLVIK